MPVLTVGASGQQFTTLSAAIAASANGDTIQVQAGTYTNDFAVINTKITIEGVGGPVKLVAQSQIDNGKGILVINNDVTLNNIQFFGATVGDGNGAGIRYQAGNLVINNCLFQDNQDGLLATPLTLGTGSITINNSEFTHNGGGDGSTHNLYVGEVASLDIENSTFTNAVVGHEIKSQADTTKINNNVIMDGPTGTASYSIDLPFGGNATITNNYIQQGPLSENPGIIHVGNPDPSRDYPNSSLLVSNNTIVNDQNSSNARALYNDGVPTSFTNNAVFGLTTATISNNPSFVTQSGTTFLAVEPQPPCFAEGTLIGTDRGEIPIEDVRVGDCVPVLFGTPTQRVVWIGKRRVDCRRHPARAQIWPVLVFAGAFGPGQPRRNLWLSPEHAVYVDDVLVPVRLLINHSSIVQVPMSTVTYYHLELERHDVLLAEGLPVESYLDTGNRDAFADPGVVVTLHPDFALRQWEAEGCAPLVMAGPKLAAARRRVNAMAADAACA